MPAQISFAADLRGVLLTYRDQMIWQLDLADYGDVKANAVIILALLKPPAQMPPPPFPPFPPEFVAAFQAWSDQGCPP